ncbi:hypothetical protein ACQV5M_22455, partial [Leptospira sp. SA-E8]|uniref:hypothetical protein n=1 Tax=Leptospira sp. SA-E8 TaxID=3422259 RepID=UPI003EBA738F
MPLPSLVQIEHPAQALVLPSGQMPVLQIAALQGGLDAAPPGRISAAAGKLAGECVVWAARAALRG